MDADVSPARRAGDRARPIALTVAPTPDVGWLLVEEGFELAREHEVESMFALSNGYIGSRGALAEGSALSAPATFVAGVFGAAPDPRGAPDPAQLAPMPDWMRLAASIDGEPLRLDRGRQILHRRALDLRQGILWREWIHEDAAGRRTRILGLRFTSLADRHLLFQSVLLVPENWSGRLDVETRIDPPLAPGPALSPVAVETAPPPGVVQVALRPAGGDAAVVFAAASAIAGAAARPVDELTAGGLGAVERYRIECDLGRALRLDRIEAVFTSRDGPHPAAAAAALVTARRDEPARVVAEHVAAWDARWREAAIDLDGDPEAERALRFAAYHLIGACNPDDDRVSVGARALTGPAYQGHVFWDTEIYMLPFYTLTHPPSARALLGYRWHTLPAAREKARARGLRGALYAWESAQSGREATPRWMIAPDGELLEVASGDREQHISADVAFAVWSYLRATCDLDFLAERGAEILVETARFWMDRGRLEADGRAHLRGVLGPDEYHPGVDDDAYTNAMARENLRAAAAAVRLLARTRPEALRALAAKVALDDGEPAAWLARAAAMYLGFDPASGLIEQFDGYFRLEDIDARRERRLVAADLLLGRERVERSQLVKQPDVVMLLALLWSRFSPSVRAANFRYYEPRTWHGSSLSPPIHALVAARLGEAEIAERDFRATCRIDLADGFGNAAGGVHAGALGGLWQAAIAGFAGARVVAGGLALAPRLPAAWRAFRFALRVRGQPLGITLLDGGRAVELAHEGDRPLGVALGDGPRDPLAPGRYVAMQQKRDGYGPWQRATPRLRRRRGDA